MAFFFGCLIATFVGRRVGWAVSRRVLYTTEWPMCILICLVWGIGLAYVLRLLILEYNPGVILTILGYGAGAYISIPNYGLVAESTIPPSQMPRHVFIKGVPWIFFMAASVLFYFTVSH